MKYPAQHATDQWVWFQKCHLRWDDEHGVSRTRCFYRRSSFWTKSYLTPRHSLWDFPRSPWLVHCVLCGQPDARPFFAVHFSLLFITKNAFSGKTGLLGIVYCERVVVGFLIIIQVETLLLEFFAHPPVHYISGYWWFQRDFRKLLRSKKMKSAFSKSPRTFRLIRLPKDIFLGYNWLKMTKPYLFLWQIACPTKSRSLTNLNQSCCREIFRHLIKYNVAVH